MNRSAPWVLGVAVLVVASTASASSDYPAEVSAQLDMDCAPPCVLCHRDSGGGLRSVRVADGGTAFGETMIDAGLRPRDPATVALALEVLDEGDSDVDFDGMSDTTELEHGRDPNIPGDASVCRLTYGCGARLAAIPSGFGGPFAMLAGLAWLFRMRRLGPGARRL